MPDEETEPVVDEVKPVAVDEVSKPAKKKPKEKPVEMSPEQVESRERAHEFKVVKFLAGGKEW